MKRVKRRYLAIQIEQELVPNEREFLDTVWASLVRLYGEVTASQSALVLINFDAPRKIAIIKVSLSCLSPLRAALTSVTSLGGKPVSFYVLAVSGTLKALYSNI